LVSGNDRLTDASRQGWAALRRVIFSNAINHHYVDRGSKIPSSRARRFSIFDHRFSIRYPR
jgi:hypothetical protein